MNWSNLLPWRWGRGKAASIRRQPSLARLALESLEDRMLPSTTCFDDAAYVLWRAQQYSVGDAAGSMQIQLNDPVQVVTQTDVISEAVPSNASFGSLIGLPNAFTSTSYRGQGYSVAIIDTGIDYRHLDLGGGF